jgi:tetratricopeptide (TPR) repeat protein
MALSHYDKVRNIFSDMGNDLLRSMVDSDSAIVYLLMDKPETAIDKLSPSLEIFNKRGAKALLAKYSVVEAEALIDLDRYKEAEKSIATALEFAKEIDDNDLILTSKLLHAVILFHIGDDIVNFNGIADKLLESSNSDEIMGRIYYEKWKIDKTEVSKEKALKIYTELKQSFNRFIDSKIINHLSSNSIKV